MARILPVEELRLLSKVSKLYYEEGLNQDDIVVKLQLSRSKISRLLKQAREEGIVKITVNSPPGIYSDLETRLENQYGMREVIVVEVSDADSQDIVSRELGVAAAAYLLRTIREKDLIGISWGSTLRSMVNAVQAHAVPEAHIVQIIGGLGRPESETHATDLCRRLSRLLSCRLTLLPAPGIVANLQAKQAMLSDIYLQRALDLLPKLTVAYVGIGSPTPDSVMIRDGNIISKPELDDLLAKGAVGDIALHFFNRDGEMISSDIDQRVIGISMEQLSKLERVVGAAGGPQKVNVVRGALCGKLINVLITDQVTAAQLVEK